LSGLFGKVKPFMVSPYGTTVPSRAVWWMEN